MSGQPWWRYGGPVVAIATLAISAAVVPAHAVPGHVASGQTNDSFAGYQVQPTKGSITSVSETFVVPTITCKKSLSGVGPAVELNSTVDKKTNSYTADAVGVGVACEKKQPVYQSIVQIDGLAHTDFSVAAGDKISVDISVSKKKSVGTLTDGTQVSTYNGKGLTGAAAFLGATSLELSKHQVGLDPFTKLKVTKAEVNGKSLKAEKAVKLTWVKGKTVLVKSSKLSKNGQDYTISFENTN